VYPLPYRIRNKNIIKNLKLEGDLKIDRRGRGLGPAARGRKAEIRVPLIPLEIRTPTKEAPKRDLKMKKAADRSEEVGKTLGGIRGFRAVQERTLRTKRSENSRGKSLPEKPSSGGIGDGNLLEKGLPVVILGQISRFSLFEKRGEKKVEGKGAGKDPSEDRGRRSREKGLNVSSSQYLSGDWGLYSKKGRGARQGPRKGIRKKISVLKKRGLVQGGA